MISFKKSITFKRFIYIFSVYLVILSLLIIAFCFNKEEKYLYIFLTFLVFIGLYLVYRLIQFLYLIFNRKRIIYSEASYISYDKLPILRFCAFTFSYKTLEGVEKQGKTWYIYNNLDLTKVSKNTLIGYIHGRKKIFVILFSGYKKID